MSAYTTDQAAQELGVIPRRVRAMIRDGVLPAEKMGRDWIISEEDLKAEVKKREKLSASQE